MVEPPYSPYETALYRHFNADGALLYVGISASLLARQASHMLRSHWSRHIATITIERFQTREAALEAEAAAIVAEKPRHNKAGVPVVEDVIDNAAEMEKFERWLSRQQRPKVSA